MCKISDLTDILHSDRCSCVISNGVRTERFYKRGILDLLALVQANDDILANAMVADKVVGKGAAALMVLGGVRQVYADVISESALSLFKQSGVEVSYGKLVDKIINRTGTDICPVEKLCAHCDTPRECLPLIIEFAETITRQ